MFLRVNYCLILVLIQITKSQDFFDNEFDHHIRNHSFPPFADEFHDLDHERPISHHNFPNLVPSSSSLLREIRLQRELQHFNIERIPERVVHGRGSAAFGHFQLTDPTIIQYSKAKVFETLGKITRIAIRFSTATGELGSADTTFGDMRGFAVKFYTEEGIWDLVGNNVPIFPIRDPEQFMSFIHANKRNPQTGLLDMNSVWDFNSLRPESLNLITYLYSDFLIPNGFRHMPGFSINAFKLVNHKNEYVFAKFLWFPVQGIENLDVETATHLRGSDPDYARRDLFAAIAGGDYPQWNLKIQIMTQQEADNLEFDAFDSTKFWPEDRFPLVDVGILTLDTNPNNFFADTEQLAFCPANLVPGIEASPDRLLHGRMFSYSDTHRYRLGPNHQLIPVNRAINPVITPTQRDGQMRVDNNLGPLDNYYPSSFSPVRDDPEYIESAFVVNRSVVFRYDRSQDQNYFQARQMYYSLPNGYRRTLHQNLAIALKQVYPFIKERMIEQISKVDPNYGRAVLNQLTKLLSH